MKLKGKDYVQVKDRVLAFNESYPNGSIQTTPIANEGTVWTFKATVFPDVSNPGRFFTAHSQDEVNGEKALEKLETVAVGRALALMGIGVLEGIASADEIVKFEAKRVERKAATDNDMMILMANADKVKLQSGTMKTGRMWFAADNFWLTKNQYDDLKTAQVMAQPNTPHDLPPNF